MNFLVDPGKGEGATIVFCLGTNWFFVGAGISPEDI